MATLFYIVKWSGLFLTYTLHAHKTSTTDKDIRPLTFNFDTVFDVIIVIKYCFVALISFVEKKYGITTWCLINHL